RTRTLLWSLPGARDVERENGLLVQPNVERRSLGERRPRDARHDRARNHDDGPCRPGCFHPDRVRASDVRGQAGDRPSTSKTQPCGSHSSWFGSNACSVLPRFTPTTTTRSTPSSPSTVIDVCVPRSNDVTGSTA